MPICPRCGKCLSSEQALTYHLNRKYKCGTWNCVKCLTNFNTKFQLQIHEMDCLGNAKRANGGFPTTEVLFKIYNGVPLVCIHLSADNTVDLVSPQCKTLFGVCPESLMGLPRSECVERLRSNNACTVHATDQSLVYIIKEKSI